MNILPSTFFGLLLVFQLVASSAGALFNESETNVTTRSTFTSAAITLTTSNVSITTPTTKPITTAPVTTSFTTAYDSTAARTGVTSMMTSSSANSTASSTITTTQTTTSTAKASGRKFDGLSFIGGMILATGLSAIILLVISYLRRNNQLPYSNLR